MAAPPSGNDRNASAAIADFRMALGASPLGCRTVQFGGIATHVEHFKRNSWGRHAYGHGLTLVAFEPAELDLTVWRRGFGPTTYHHRGSQILYIPPECPFSLNWHNAADGIFLFSSRQWAQSAFPNLPDKYEAVGTTQCMAAVPMVADMFNHMRQFCHHPNRRHDDEVGSAGAFLATLLFRAQAKLIDGQYIPVGLFADAIAKIRNHLAQHHQRRVPVGEIARQLGISDRQLRRVVRHETGKSPVAWVREEKARHVRDLLSQGIPLKEAVVKSGFSNPSHLHRAMSRVFGGSARAFRGRRKTAG